MASNDANGQVYQVNFTNKSSMPGNVVVFQQDPNMARNNVMSLAWFAKYAFPGTDATFDWTIDYSFLWAQTGVLNAGVQFVASQVLPADLSTMNEIELTYDAANNAFHFQDQEAGTAGSLTIQQDGTIPVNNVSVGIGMSGAGTFAVQAEPNVNTMFTPHPEYWVAFGNYQKGEVLDIQSMTHSAAIQFPPNVFSMDATLNYDNTWTIQPSVGARALVAPARVASAQKK